MSGKTVLVGLSLGLVVVVGLFVWRAHSERDTRRDAARAELAKYERVQHDIDANARRLSAEYDALDREERKALASGTKRHDEAVRGGQSTASNLALAKREQAGVLAAESHLENMEERLDTFASISARVLGDDAVRQYRTDTQAWTTSLRLHFGNWSRAITDIVDADIMEMRGSESSSGASDAAHLFAASDEAEARAAVQVRAVSNDAKQIRSAIRARIAGAKARLARI